MTDNYAFQRYRDASAGKTTLPRLFFGTVITIICWIAATFGCLFAGFFIARLAGAASTDTMQEFAGSGIGTLAVFLSFAGIWVGLWLAMLLLHREPFSALFGVSRRILAGEFGKGLAAVLITSVVSEVAIYAIAPQMERSSVPLSIWIIAFVPVCLLAFVQTSAEELLFRGYLLRGLAYRFRSPWIWGLLPGLAFTALHYSGGSNLPMIVCLLISIGAFAVLLVLLVHRTGNLGASIGAHFGNNITGFLLISHESSFSAFSLFRGASLDRIAWTAGTTTLISLTGVVCVFLTGVLLLHPRSPLKVRPDEGGF